MKKVLSIVLTAMLVVTMLSGCGGESSSDKEVSSDVTTTDSENKDGDSSAEPVSEDDIVLTLAIMDTPQEEYFNEKDIAALYMETHPNVTLEIEKHKDSGAFEEAIKIKSSANELPDLMTFKPYMLATFKDQVIDLSDIEATKNNLYAAEYAMDGAVVGLPEVSARTYVFYWKSVYEDYGIEIPQTWQEFIDAGITLKENSDLIPIVMGAKDAWADYPFNEYMPSMEADDGALWNTMATMDHPFSEGQPFNIAYRKIQELYDAKVFGVDPLGLSFDQGKALFGEHKGGMILGGVWLYPFLDEANGDSGDLGAYLMPTRVNESEEFRTIVQADIFWAISNECEHPEEAKEFLNWYFSKEWYDEYVNTLSKLPTVEGVVVELPEVLQEAIDGQPDAKVVLYDGGNADFKSIVTETKFDVKVIGQEMMIDGFDFDKKMEDLNEMWANARKTLEIE